MLQTARFAPLKKHTARQEEPVTPCVAETHSECQQEPVTRCATSGQAGLRSRSGLGTIPNER